MKTHQSSRLRINVTSTGSELRCSIGVLIFLFIITSGIQHVEGRTSLNPLAIGVRSAIARAPVLTSHPPSSKFTIHRKADLNRFDAPLKYDDVESDEIENLPSVASSIARGGGTAVAPTDRRLHFWEAMVCGAISRSAAQTIMHPANTMKTILQSSRSIPGKAPLTVKSFARWENAKMLTRGAGAQLLLSIPHGAVNFAVLEFVRRQMNNVVSRSRYAERINRGFGPGMDFLSSALSTVCCSVVSTPQMMICDNIMAGTYPNLVAATSCLMKDRGISGFYTGWWPGIAGKIPSYGLTWTLFEQIKLARTKMFKRPAKDIENSIMGCLASATTICIMIPMDTVKTRLVTQMNYPDLVPYKGINDCFRRVLKEEGIGAFYRGLTPRLLSVVPMIGIQFGVYEFMKKFMLARDAKTSLLPARGRVSKAEMKRREDEAAIEKSRKERLLQEMALEVAADDDQPFPAPYFKHKGWWAEKISGK